MSTNSNEKENNKPLNAQQLTKKYTYEEPENDDLANSPLAQQQEGTTETSSSITQQWAQVMNTVNIHNMQKLVNQDEFIIEGKTYIPRRLKPVQILELNKLQTQISAIPDWNEKKFELTKKQATICLEGWSNEDFDNTDLTYLEQVLGACLLRTKGFRKL